MKNTGLLLALLGIWGLRPVAAQERFFDTVDVRVLDLEVVVEDRDGKPIDGLQVSDFELFENGKKLEISNFLAITDGRAVVAPEESAVSGAESEAIVPTENLRLVVLFDDSHLSAQSRIKAVERLSHLFKNSLKSGDEVLLARLTERVEIEQPLTGDIALLETALDRFSAAVGQSQLLQIEFRKLMSDIRSTSLSRDSADGGSLAPSSRVSGADFTETAARFQARQIVVLGEQRLLNARRSIQAISGFIDSLAGLSGRKALLLVSDGIPVEAAQSLIEAWEERYQDWARINNRGDLMSELSSVGGSRLNVRRELDELSRYAAASQVTFYPFSPTSSLGSLNADLSAENAGSGTSLGSRGNISQSTEIFSVESSLLQLAEATGGVAMTRSSAIDLLFERLRHDFTTFYSLGYRPLEDSQDKGRKVEVKVKNQDWKVRHAAFARDRDPLEKLQDLTMSTLQHGFAVNPLDLRIEESTQKAGEKDRVTTELLVKIPFEKLLLLPEEEFHSGRVTLYVAVLDEKSHGVSAMQRIELPLRVPNEQILEVLTQTATYPLRLAMTPGLKRIAIGARDHLSRTDATASLEIDVKAAGDGR